MTILSSEIKCYKSETASSDDTNGGRMSTNEVISGVVNNVWPHVLKAERNAGSTLYRKLFFKVANDNDEKLIATSIFDDIPTPAGDYIVFWEGTQTDTQATAKNHSGRVYGAANLHSDVSSGSSTIVVDVEDSSITGIFQDGDKIRLTDMDDPNAATGNEEELTISGAPSVSGTQVTITVAETIGNDYTVAGGGRVMSLLQVGDIEATSDNWAESSTSGTYDEGSYPVIPDAIGTIEQSVTLTFTDATHFTATSNVSGVTLGSGDTSTDFSPNNPDFNKPYFTLEAAGWDGTWAQNDTVTFDTHPAAEAVWFKRVVPAGTASMANNKNVSCVSGESA